MSLALNTETITSPQPSALSVAPQSDTIKIATKRVDSKSSSQSSSSSSYTITDEAKNSSNVFIVDGKVVKAEELCNIPSGTIESVEIRKETKDGKPLSDVSELKVIAVGGAKLDDATRKEIAEKGSGDVKSKVDTALDEADYFIDGKKVSKDEFMKVNSSDIESMEVNRSGEKATIKMTLKK